VCAGCPVRIQCLDGAVRRAEPYGIWGGVLATPEAPFRWLRHHLTTGDPLAYAAALREATERPVETPAGPCPRCEGEIQAGIYPIDRNPAGATCGHVSTYNRGCRCDPCKAGKSAYSKALATRRLAPVVWIFRQLELDLFPDEMSA